MPTMNVSLTPEFVRFVEGEVESGAYAQRAKSYATLRLLQTVREERALRLAQLKNAVESGLGQMERGEFSTRSLDDIFKGVASEAQR